MPEGDTVKNTAMALDKALAGQVITRSDFRVPQLATVDLSGWTVRECGVRGKHLLLRVIRDGSTDRTLHSHLRMDGTWQVYRPSARPLGRPAHLIRVILTTETAKAVGFHLHELALIPTAQEGSMLDHLGPDLLGPDWDQDEAIRRLTAQPDRPIAEALLDQRNLAGIGNMYKSELLFLRGILPDTRVGDVADLAAMVTLAKKLITANVGRGTQSTTGSLRDGETYWVYGRPGRPCRRCGTLIRREEQDRVTFWCPHCQR
jgi:endonuclease-8